MQAFFLDRIENGYAILLGKRHTEVKIEHKLLPADCGEGDFLLYDGEVWRVQRKLGEKFKAKARIKLHNLYNKTL